MSSELGESERPRKNDEETICFLAINLHGRFF